MFPKVLNSRLLELVNTNSTATRHPSRRRSDVHLGQRERERWLVTWVKAVSSHVLVNRCKRFSSHQRTPDNILWLSMKGKQRAWVQERRADSHIYHCIHPRSTKQWTLYGPHYVSNVKKVILFSKGIKLIKKYLKNAVSNACFSFEMFYLSKYYEKLSLFPQ